MKILIGIQARSGSTRLPNKAMEPICGITMLDRVIDSCTAAANKVAEKTGAVTCVAVLTPTGDPIASHFRGRAEIMQGPESDVLGRYLVAVEEFDPDYVIRITGDCPLIPSATIIGMTLMALRHQYDYFSNVDERFRTAIDGTDCEIISRRLLLHAGEMAKEPGDREHVTTYLRRCPPVWAKYAMAINHFDHSNMKLSVDTAEDLEAVRRAFDSSFSKYQAASRVYGKGRVHRI